MKIILLFLTFVIGLRIAKGQTVISSCSSFDSIVASYKDDADRLAVRKIFRVRSVYKDSIKIPTLWSDTVMNALIAVYNATMLPARDTVVNSFNIHTFPNPILNNISVGADSNLTWMHQLHNNIIPTGNLSVDSLISDYNLHLSSYEDWYHFQPYHSAIFQSDSNYNISALAYRFDSIPGVFYAEQNGYIGDGNDIQDSIYSNFVELIYSLGWDDCPSGCISRRFWKFRVYHDCSVEYIESYGTPLNNTSTTISIINKSGINIFPNPFQDKILIENKGSTYEYILMNSFGQIIRRAQTSATTIDNLADLPKGIYLLRLFIDNRTNTIKLVKE